ncbi:MAG: hypothetical protein A2W61_02905 [Deltaproteobacteria bacterium RIFCSPLOWO2_01_44_7]|nr:MAG: hypothetical protein A2712_07490 [Deltaproteobacteria bacterium RIFCSPHIGHO2_01_FULL_43_49]OGQ14813.1 MAG: hypothetical protein A3D22_09505 [Deltaproteobacteria bacterium RIFCSPHIGHO2_02_FULL_44_53]OGQ28199.1 MAG: hypothetical protein A3D98_08215 [Deltaproteobacteria bacterium RIFCSPHIGHO2_12_FULL_44_21]OGQ31411.1 MAG: hypothetical protein A2979_08265 [Deltaproteobacteria bacterium RIFCSPLOWO2_01_FULL_45_74]OGQ38411.1 MAG: hypothetical protein A2W61_02905 [Deltaproteobacteria bacterium 
MSLLTIDSSVYLSALIAADSFHKPSKEFFHQINKKKVDVVLPILVPLEVANILCRQGLPITKVQQIFESFYSTPKTRILALDWALGKAFIEEIGKFNLKTADWLIAATCFYLESTLITWDKQLLENTKVLLKSKMPTEWME